MGQPKKNPFLKSTCTRTLQAVVKKGGVSSNFSESLATEFCKQADANTVRFLASSLVADKYKPKGAAGLSLKVQSLPKYKQYGKNKPSITIPVGPVKLQIWGDPYKIAGGLNVTVMH